MKKIYLLSLFILTAHAGSSVEKVQFDDLITNINQKLSESSKELELKNNFNINQIETIINKCKQNCNLEVILNEIDKAIVFAVSDVCVPNGSNELPLIKKSKDLRKILTTYQSDIAKFISNVQKKLPKEFSELEFQSRIFYLTALNRRAEHQLKLLDNICKGNVCA